jgi:hypothetical protein
VRTCLRGREQAGQVLDAVRERVAERAAGPLPPAADEAISAELAPLLAALRVSGG